ncbi:hypothetical protein L1887_16237 [Cichorium endivia]|nr:hypothetical protein L1887_16237 [Cichorium endivia]
MQQRPDGAPPSSVNRSTWGGSWLVPNWSYPFPVVSRPFGQQAGLLPAPFPNQPTVGAENNHILFFGPIIQQHIQPNNRLLNMQFLLASLHRNGSGSFDFEALGLPNALDGTSVRSVHPEMVLAAADSSTIDLEEGYQGTDVAIKRLNIDSNQGATEFQAEIEMLSKLRHSHINRASAHDQKHIGRTIFFEKAWSLFMIKTPKGRMSSPIEKLGQSINTTVVEGGCESGGIATASQQVVLSTGQTKIPNLKVFTFSELQRPLAGALPLGPARDAAPRTP